MIDVDGKRVRPKVGILRRLLASIYMLFYMPLLGIMRSEYFDGLKRIVRE